MLPEWWFEAALPSAVFGMLFVLWVLIPSKNDEVDLGSRIRDFFARRLRGRVEG